MPRLSLYKPEKGNDFAFQDRNIAEMFQIGGTDAYIHKYLGPVDQGGTDDASQPQRSGDSLNELAIQDLLFLENRDRKYEPDVYHSRVIYNVQDIDFDLSQFGMFLQNDQLFMTFHIKDIVEALGRKIMSGDVIELPHLKDEHSLDENDTEALKRYYVVEDVARSAEGFSKTWWPHLYRVRCKGITDAQEFRDILGDKDENTAQKTRDKDIEINDAVVAQAESDAPQSGYNTKQLHVMPTDEDGKVALVTVDEEMKVDTGHINIDKVYASPEANGYIEGYLTGDAIPANGETYSFGTSFPNAPIEGMFFLRTDYTPNRLFRYDGRRFVKIEDNVRVTMSNTDTRNTNKTGFINNTNTTVSATDGSTNVPERVALSKLLKPQADN
jgi:hypothetical protein|tara:strand:- start:590 stop:1741 length:1152 start_codon:yes stop_codon:yes gene_type:complete